MADRAVHLRVEGRVQGVGFRYFVQRAAERTGVAGYVRNLPDGDVEAVAEGPAESVESFLVEVRQGPRMSRVSGLRVRELDPAAGQRSGFEIRY